MKARLTFFSLLALGSLLAISVWASLQIGVLASIADVLAHPRDGNNPWLIGTLLDAYFGFLWFWLWVAYKETSWTVRAAWLVVILLLGNMAMATYMLLVLMKLPPNPGMKDVLLRRP